jgi:hypothetical protein
MIIHAYGLFWRQDEVLWYPGAGTKNGFRMLGRRGVKSTVLELADFRKQTGIYILYGDYGRTPARTKTIPMCRLTRRRSATFSTCSISITGMTTARRSGINLSQPTAAHRAAHHRAPGSQSLAERRRNVERAVAPSQHHHDREFAKRRLVAICIAQGDAPPPDETRRLRTR